MLAPKGKLLGYVAEYCTVCRDIVPARLLRIPRPGAQVIPRPTEDVFCCTACEHTVATEAHRYRSFANAADEPLEKLVAQTHPDLPEVMAPRIFHERAAIVGEDQSIDRRAWMQESLRTLAYVPNVCADKAMRHATLVSVLVGGSLFVVGSCVWSMNSVTMTDQRAIRWSLLVLFVPIGVTIAIYLATRALRIRRTARAILTRMLARSLRPLRPTEAELKELLTWCSVALPAIHRVLDADMLHAAIRAERDVSLANVDHLAHVYPNLKLTTQDFDERPNDADQ
jgi:cytochrome c oxidase subunit IV